ncbi:MAG: hypothetical protein ACXIUM_02035 [Wenzhouxiangella sp.]
MHKTITMLTMLTLAFAASVSIASGEIERDLLAAGVETNSTPVSLSDLRVQLNLKGALVRSPEHLSRHLQSFAEGQSPLDQLSAQGKSESLASLQFGPSGVASMNTDLLERELTPTQSYSILELFGWQELAPRLRHAKVKTEMDAQLNFLCDGASFGSDDCTGGYVRGRCISTATCGGFGGGWCHPPSCP